MKSDKVAKSIYATNAFYGPDVCFVPIQSHDEVIKIIESLKATRCFGIHTKYFETVSEFHKTISVPSLLWNASTVELNPILPNIGWGNAGNSYVTGVRSIFSTVYPKSLNY